MSAPVLAERVKPARNPRLSETIFSARQRTDASVSLEQEKRLRVP
jgi:hypothetical protein